MTVRWVPLVLFTPLAVAFVVLYLRAVADAWRVPDLIVTISVDASPFQEAVRRAGVSVNEFARAMAQMNEATAKASDVLKRLAEQLSKDADGPA